MAFGYHRFHLLPSHSRYAPEAFWNTASGNYCPKNSSEKELTASQQTPACGFFVPNLTVARLAPRAPTWRDRQEAPAAQRLERHQKSPPAQWTWGICDGFEALKGGLYVLVLLEPPQRRWKGGIKHLNSPGWPEWCAFIPAKMDFFWSLLHILLRSEDLNTPITGYSY